MAIEIRETTVTPNGEGTFVELRISDVLEPDDKTAISLVLAVQVGTYEFPLLAHYQREAMEAVRDELDRLLRDSERELLRRTLPVHPRPA